MGKVITIGELMLRLTPPGKERLHRTTMFHSYYGGAEANVAVSLGGFGHDVTFLSALPDNALGTGAIRHLRSNNVNTEWLYSAGERLGLYYYEEGYAARHANVIYDRKHSSIHELPSLDIDWEKLYQDVDILHLTGITPALSEELKALTLEAVQQAVKYEVKVSFDFNYRSKLWSLEEAKETFLAILPYVSICFAGYKDFVFLLGEAGPKTFDATALKGFYQVYRERYSIDYFISTDRRILEGQEQQLAAYLYHNGEFYQTSYSTIHVLERIGGGDAFASGILHGILTKRSPEYTIHFGIGSSILKHTIYGDDNQVTAEEVEQFLVNKNKDVVR